MNDAKVDYASPKTPGDSLWEWAQRRRSLVMILGIATLLVICLLAYWTAMRGDFIWDDDHYVTQNSNLRSWEGLKTIWVPDDFKALRTQYYPLANTAFWIQYRLFGLNATAYHVVNVVLHAFAAMLLWLILRKLDVRGAWAAAAVWAIHPVQVESVAWITELKNILSAVFYFGTILIYFRYTELMVKQPESKATAAPAQESIFTREWFSLPTDPTRVYALAIFLFACALLSKSVTATLPAALLLIVWWKRGRIRWNEDIVPLLPFFAMGIAMSAVTGWIEKETIGASGGYWDYAPTWMGEIGAHAIIAGRAIWFYFTKLLVPFPLIFNYPRWHISAGAVWQYVFPLSAVTALAALWMLRHRIGRGPLVAALYFVGTLVPALGFVDVYPMQYSFVADHFQYLACIGLIVLAIGALSHGIDRLVRFDLLNPAAAPAAVFVLLGALAIRSSRQGMIYQNLNTLWRDTILQTGGAYTTSWFASNNYGVLLLNMGEMDKADRWFTHALKINDRNAAAWFNKALVAERRGQLDDALRFYQTCLRNQRDYGPAKINLAELLVRMGRHQDALATYKAIVEESPDEEVPRVNYGQQLYLAGRLSEAIQQYNEALRIDPSSWRAHLFLGDALAAAGQDIAALQEYRQVVEIDTNNAEARLGVGNIFASRARFDEAAAAFQLAAKLDPRLAKPVFNLGKVYMLQGKYEDAIVQFDKLLKLAPNFPKAKENLDEALDLLAHPEKWPATTQSATRPTTRMTATTRP